MSLRTCVAISAFRSDGAVSQLLGLAALVAAPPWEKIFVVDSLGSGALQDLINREGWGDRVAYHTFPTNLGSAGNLAKRLELAAAEGFDVAYTVNHDGVIDPEAVRELVNFAEARSLDRLGAVYPLRRHLRQNGKYDLTGTYRVPVPFRGTDRRPEVDFKVHWASSNGALYVLDRVREGLSPFADFWLGWEDLAYGWLLEDRGFEQWVDVKAVFEDDYEYRVRGQGSLAFAYTEKPYWYTYYQVRNLLLATQRTRAGALTRGVVAGRIASELCLTMLLRDRKLDRTRLLAQGLIDGLRGRAGKGALP